MSLAEASAHQEKHGFKPPRMPQDCTGTQTATTSSAGSEAQEGAGKRREAGPNLPKPVKMSRPEKEMGMMLEAQKRAGEIADYRFQGMSLAYSPDPETGIVLRYKCDWVVIPRADAHFARIKIIECKGDGKHAISAAAKLRFKGAKAAWPMFKFEMWQRLADGQWRRVL